MLRLFIRIFQKFIIMVKKMRLSQMIFLFLKVYQNSVNLNLRIMEIKRLNCFLCFFLIENRKIRILYQIKTLLFFKFVPMIQVQVLVQILKYFHYDQYQEIIIKIFVKLICLNFLKIEYYMGQLYFGNFLNCFLLKEIEYFFRFN